MEGTSFVKVLYLGLSPVEIEGFDHTVERSCLGAIHFKPKTVKTLTADEFAFIQRERPELALHVFKDGK